MERSTSTHIHVHTSKFSSLKCILHTCFVLDDVRAERGHQLNKAQTTSSSPQVSEARFEAIITASGVAGERPEAVCFKRLPRPVPWKSSRASVINWVPVNFVFTAGGWPERLAGSTPKRDQLILPATKALGHRSVYGFAQVPLHKWVFPFIVYCG